MDTKTKGKTKTEKAPKEKKAGVGSVAREAIIAGKTNAEALEIVKKAFPDKSTTAASINWYRNQLRAEGVKGVKTAREMKKAAEPAKQPAKKGAKGKASDPTA